MKLTRLCSVLGTLLFLLGLYAFSHRSRVVRGPRPESVLPKIKFPARKDHGLSRIPNIIHQTWKGPKDIPLMFKTWVQTWINQNEEFEYWFWDDEDISNLIEHNYPDLLQLFQSYPTSGYRVDVFRYMVLYEHGGIYADLDTECLKPILPVIGKHSCVLAQEPHEHAHFLAPLGIPLVSNAVMACEPRHVFFENVISNLHRYTGWTGWSDILHATGPYMLTQAYRSFSGSWFGHQHPDTPDLAAPEVFLPTIDTSMVDRIRDTCLGPRGSGSAAHAQPASASSWFKLFSSDKTTEELCSHLLGSSFNNLPKEESYTNHHWTHTWATKLHDPWGVKNWRVFFSIEELKPK